MDYPCVCFLFSRAREFGQNQYYHPKKFLAPSRHSQWSTSLCFRRHTWSITSWKTRCCITLSRRGAGMFLLSYETPFKITLQLDRPSHSWERMVLLNTWQVVGKNESKVNWKLISGQTSYFKLSVSCGREYVVFITSIWYLFTVETFSQS